MKQVSTYSKTTMRYEMRMTAEPPLTKFGSYLHYHKTVRAKGVNYKSPERPRLGAK